MYLQNNENYTMQKAYRCTFAMSSPIFTTTLILSIREANKSPRFDCANLVAASLAAPIASAAGVDLGEDKLAVALAISSIELAKEASISAVELAAVKFTLVPAEWSIVLPEASSLMRTVSLQVILSFSRNSNTMSEGSFMSVPGIK